jgi:hypothetical protein
MFAIARFASGTLLSNPNELAPNKYGDVKKKPARNKNALESENNTKWKTVTKTQKAQRKNTMGVRISLLTIPTNNALYVWRHIRKTKKKTEYDVATYQAIVPTTAVRVVGM